MKTTYSEIIQALSPLSDLVLFYVPRTETTTMYSAFIAPVPCFQRRTIRRRGNLCRMEADDTSESPAAPAAESVSADTAAKKSKNKRKPTLKPPPVRPPTAPTGGTRELTEEERNAPFSPLGGPSGPAPTSAPGGGVLESSLLSSMRDYFGDDGREAEAFCSRPRSKSGLPMFRVLIVGSTDAELALAKALSACNTVMGVYYAPDNANVCDVRFAPYGTSTVVSSDDPEGILDFARWALVDAVFVGSGRQDAVPANVEAELANSGVTLFPHDVSDAVADGTLDPQDCLAPISDDLPPDSVVVGTS